MEPDPGQTKLSSFTGRFGGHSDDTKSNYGCCIAKAGASASVSGLIGSDKSLPEYMVTHGLNMISESKKAEWEAKWEKLRLAEFDLLVKKNRLTTEETELILNAFTSSNQ